MQLQQHVDRLAKVTADLRRKNELLSTMAKNFIQEKSELQSELRAIGKGMPPEHVVVTSREVVDGGRQRSADNGTSEAKEKEEGAPSTMVRCSQCRVLAALPLDFYLK